MDESAGLGDVTAQQPVAQPPEQPDTAAADAAPPAATAGPGWTPPPPFEVGWTPPPFDGTSPVVRTPEDAANASISAAMRLGEYWFVSSRKLATATTVLLGLSGLLAVAQVVHNIAGVDLQGRINRTQAVQADADAFNALRGNLAILALVLTIVTGIVFMRWLWRCVGNATVLGAEYSFVTPRGSVTAWLVPIRNLWKPYLVVSKLQAALLSPLESRSGRWLVRLWWLFWLAGSVVSEVLVYTTRSSDLQSGNTRLTIMAGLAVSSIVTVADAALAIAVVRQIQRLSEAREAARRGNPEQAIELVSASQRRRVTLLPFGVAAGAILALVIPLAAVTAGAAAERPWQEFTAPDGAFTISMPGTPVEEQVTTAPGGFSYHTGSDATLVLTVSYLQFPAGALDASKAATALDQVVAAIPGAPAGSVTKVDGHPAETASWSIGATHSKGMFVFDAEASRLYLVEADFTASRAGSPEIDRFIGSFRLK